MSQDSATQGGFFRPACAVALVIAIALPLVAAPLFEVAWSAVVATPPDAACAPAVRAARKDVEEYLAVNPAEKRDLPAARLIFSEGAERGAGSLPQDFPGDLVTFYRGKSILVVGGSKGIGRGIALQAAALGAGSVHIVGSSDAGDKTVARMREESGGGSADGGGDFRFFRANLFTIDGCRKLVRELSEAAKPKSGGVAYDLVVFTVGQWPDLWSGKPLTPAGYEKGVFLAVIARFAVLRFLMEQELLSFSSAVLSVLASGQRAPPEFMLPMGSDDKFRSEFVPSMLQPQSADFQPQLQATLLTEMQLNDAMLMRLAELHPNIHFLGTMPGLIATDIGQTALGARAQRAGFFVAQLLGLTISEKRCGVHHLAIVRGAVEGMPLPDQAPESQEGKGTARNWSLWDHYVVAREPSRLLLGPKGKAFRDAVHERLSEIVGGLAQ